MSIRKEWQNLVGEDDNDLIRLLDQQKYKAASGDPLTILKKNIIINTGWAIIIAAGYLLVIIKYPYWPIISGMGIMFTFTSIGAATNVRLINKISKRNNSNSLLQEMERHYRTITTWMRQQEKAMVFVYPVAAIGGFMLGWSVFSAKPVEEMLKSAALIVSIIVSFSIIVPAGYFLAKFLNKKAFGQYCDQLKRNIEALKEVR